MSPPLILGWFLFSFRTFYPSTFWPSCYLRRNQLLILLNYCMWWVTSFLMFSQFFLCISVKMYKVSQCDSLWVYPARKSLSFLNMYIHMFSQIWEFFNHCFLKYFFCHSLTLFSSGAFNNAYVDMFYGIPASPSGSIHFYSFFFLLVPHTG